MELGAGPHGIHRVLVQFAGRRVLETVINIGAEADAVVLVFLVRDGLDEDGRVEVDEGAGQDTAAVLGDIDRDERAVGAVGLTDGGNTPAPAGVRVQVIGLLSCDAVTDLHQVRSIHGVPLAVHEPGEKDSLVPPLAQVLHRRGPHADVAAAVGRVSEVMGADDVRAVLSRLVGIFENTGFTVGKVLPERQVRVLSPDRGGGQEGRHEDGDLFHEAFTNGCFYKYKEKL